MNWKTPFFTVVIPTYNRPALLCRAIDSVLGNGEESVEIIVVDDGSTAAYPDLKARYDGNVRYYKGGVSKGAAASRNIGVSLATGEWIVFLDDDDELTSGYLSRVKYAASSREDCKAVWSGARVVRRSGDEVCIEEHTFPENYSNSKYLVKDLLSVGLGFGFAIEKKVFSDIEGFDEGFSVGEDTELFFRLVSNGCIPAPVPGVGVIKHEEHDDRLSSDYEVYSRKNVYNKIFQKHSNGFCKHWRYNYIHMLMWSYRLHRSYGNEDCEQDDFNALVQLGIPEEHIDQCYVAGADLSPDYVERGGGEA